MPAAYRNLRKRLGEVSWIAMGSVLERNKPGQGGPRYQWTRRIEGKTLTVALSAEQFQWLQQAIANQREILATLTQMQHLSMEYMWKNLPSAKLRKKLNKKSLGTN